MNKNVQIYSIKKNCVVKSKLFKKSYVVTIRFIHSV